MLVIALSEQQIVDQIAARLSQSYPGVPADAVSRMVREHHARFEDRPIRDFIPLLVERHARAQLDELEASAALL